MAEDKYIDVGNRSKRALCSVVVRNRNDLMAETSEQRFPRGRPLVVIVADLKNYLFGWRLD